MRGRGPLPRLQELLELQALREAGRDLRGLPVIRLKVLPWGRIGRAFSVVIVLLLLAGLGGTLYYQHLQIADLQDDLQSLHRELGGLADADDFDSKLDSLEMNLDDASASVDHLSLNFEVALSRLDDVEATLSRLNSTVSDVDELQAELEEVSARVQALEAEQSMVAPPMQTTPGLRW